MKKTSKKGLVLLVALALLVGVTAGSTLAWLLDTTAPVTNTFTTSEVDISFTETTTDYQMVPGHTITKNPIVTVEGGSEKCYVFVKLVRSTNYDSYMTYDIADGWTALASATDANNGTYVYYREVGESAADQSFGIIKGDTVNVLESVTNQMMDAAKTNKPTLTISAYACQFYKDNTNAFDVEAAWESVKDLGATDAYTPTTPTP